MLLLSKTRDCNLRNQIIDRMADKVSFESGNLAFVFQILCSIYQSVNVTTLILLITFGKSGNSCPGEGVLSRLTC